MHTYMCPGIALIFNDLLLEREIDCGLQKISVLRKVVNVFDSVDNRKMKVNKSILV